MRTVTENDSRKRADAQVKSRLEDIRAGLDACGIAHSHLNDSDLQIVIAYGYCQLELSGQPFTFEGWLLALGVVSPARAVVK